MKGLNCKSLYVVGSLLASSCVGYKQSIIDTQRQLSHIRNNAGEKVVSDHSCVSNNCGHEYEINRQDRPNSCNIASVQMIVNTYGGYGFTEEQLQQTYRRMYPLGGRMIDHLFHEQNPQVGRIAQFINHYLVDHKAYKTKQQLAPELIERICSQGGALMISIHSRLGYPHRVVVIGCHYDNNGVMLIQFLNPSSTLQDQKGNHLGYRNQHIPRKETSLGIDPVVNEVPYEEFKLLHDQTLFTYPRPINRHHTGYIIVSKEPKKAD